MNIKKDKLLGKILDEEVKEYFTENSFAREVEFRTRLQKDRIENSQEFYTTVKQISDSYQNVSLEEAQAMVGSLGIDDAVKLLLNREEDVFPEQEMYLETFMVQGEVDPDISPDVMDVILDETRSAFNEQHAGKLYEKTELGQVQKVSRDDPFYTSRAIEDLVDRTERNMERGHR